MSKLGLIGPSEGPPAEAVGKARKVAPVAGVAMGVHNAVIIGDVSIVYNDSTGIPVSAGERDMADAEQTIKKVKSRGSVSQRSTARISQTMDDVDAEGDVQQIIEEAARDPAIVAEQVKKLRDAVHAFDPNAAVELARLDAAEEAARRGDSSGAIASLEGLGRWVVKIATDIGAATVAKLIEKQVGM
jgi:hypothetical protein